MIAAAPCPPVAVHDHAVVVCRRVVHRGQQVWDAAQQIADNYLRFVRVYQDAESAVTTS